MAVITSFTRVCKLDKPNFEIIVIDAQNTVYNINRIILDMQKNLISNDNQAFTYRTAEGLSWGSRVSYQLSLCLVALAVYSPPACHNLWFLFLFFLFFL